MITFYKNENKNNSIVDFISLKFLIYFLFWSCPMIPLAWVKRVTAANIDTPLTTLYHSPISYSHSSQYKSSFGLSSRFSFKLSYFNIYHHYNLAFHCKSFFITNYSILIYFRILQSDGNFIGLVFILVTNIALLQKVSDTN